MASILAVLQVIVCVFLILVIMIQDPKGGGSGLFSNNSSSILGAGGGADFLTKLTRYVGVLFGALCIALTIVTKPAKSGVFSKGAATNIEQPAAPTPATGNAATGTEKAAPTSETSKPTSAPSESKPAQKK
jgi:preprotein translocase subunit SecG